MATAIAESHLSAERIREECATHLQRIQELHDEVPPADQTSAGTEAILLLKEIVCDPENSVTEETTCRLDDILAAMLSEMPGFTFEEEPHIWDEVKHSPDITC